MPLDPIQEKAMLDVLRERAKQDNQWGVQNHDPSLYLTILMEEVGEFAKEALEDRINPFRVKHDDIRRVKMREEAVQVAAVSLAIVECLDRGKWEWPEDRLKAIRIYLDGDMVDHESGDDTREAIRKLLWGKL